MNSTTVYEQFEHKLLNERYAQDTVRRYVKHVSDLLWHFQRQPKEIEESELKEYLMLLVFNRKCSYYHMRSTIAGLRAFFRLVLRRSESDISELIPSMGAPKRFPVIYTPDEVERLLGVEGLRISHRAMLMTLYGAGLRPEEVCRLTVSDIMSSRMQIRVGQTGDQKERYAPLSSGLLGILRG